MSEKKVIFTDEQISNYVKYIDGAIDWRKVFEKKVNLLWGIIKIDLGNILEKSDRNIWTKAFQFLNQLYMDDKIGDSLADLLKSVFAAIDGKDEDALITTIAEAIAGKINILSDDTKEETLIKSALTMLSTLDNEFLDDLNSEFEKLEAKAEEQDS